MTSNVQPVLSGPSHAGTTEGVLIDADLGADAALEELYDEHYLRLVRLAVLLLGDAGRAEEVVQDSFVAIYQRWDRMAGVDVVPYLRQTVVNRSRSVQRHLGVVERNRSWAVDHAPPADHPALASARRRAVLEALGELPRRQREVLALRYYLDLSEREIADALEISPGAVKSHASRGAKALREILSQLLEEDS